MGSTIKHFKTTADGELSRDDIEANFDDLHAIFTPEQAVVEASRCLYCYDAPCLNACPTSINIPKFIRQIHAADSDGAAKTILSENILGGTCARACPTEELCEEVCVVHQTEESPVKIGQLQRFAVDGLLQKRGPHPFEREPATGVTFAVIGAGPAGLAFAHRFAMLGNNIVIFERQEKPGGLNEYGLAAYKMAGDFAQREVNFLLEIGGVEIRYGQTLGENITLDQLREQYDGVFIGIGLGEARKLSIPGADLNGVDDAIDFIEGLRQTDDKTKFRVGDNVVVIGGGNTAIDAAVQARCLGARSVTLAYRRGAQEMSATDWEQQLASTNGVNVVHWASPRGIAGEVKVEGVIFDRTKSEGGKLVTTGEQLSVPADSVLVAIGQTMIETGLDQLDVQDGKIKIDANYQTSLSNVYAGGDCTATGTDLTVQAVEDGKQAAICADVALRSRADVAAE